MSMSLAQPSYSMEEEDVIIILENGNSGNGDRPRTGVPITASLDNGVISTVVDTYTGDVAVTIEDEDGEMVISDVEVVSGHTLFTTNVSSLPDGTYTIIYTLGNSVYYGVFVID
ncbi:MAG: DUF3244 domain-containing protein [Bacteroidaceae bacterium]|nr:DUF3244 domain-containing protein [Bacteroidaceae bacterium]